ncbi:DUF4870 domain-containing protein [Candidatus Kaiserbacteria bacterium]|nr:DUF4870 domain-containing protein [Candidatus Kaiserbacteria bacterium]NCT01791.1 DUF4870 domain-containing protein [Candidatus Parcubacteria bacterium]
MELENKEEVKVAAEETKNVPEETVAKTTDAPSSAPKLSFSVIGYILPFLFFLPLLDEKTKRDPMVKFHANQQLLLLILIGGVYLLHSTVLAVLSSFGYFVMQLLSVGIIILIAIGAYNAQRGKMNELPYVGQFRILK